MDRRSLLTTAGAALGWTAAMPRETGAQARKKILFFTKSSGFQHSVIKREGDQLGHAERVLTELGTKHGFDVTCTKDGGVFTRDRLAAYDAFFFYTTGDLTTPGTDKNPPMTAEGKQTFLDLVKEGKASSAVTARPIPFTPSRTPRTAPIGT